MNLKTQEYLRSGKTLEDLKTQYGIKYKVFDNLVVLNYHQIDSPKTHPIVMECRSLILELNSWNIVSWAFKRFFNYNENLEETEDFDFQNAIALEKIDGSLCQVFNYKNKWYMSTRGSIEGEGNVGLIDITFKQLFDKIITKDFYQNLNTSYIYIFEIASPLNKVVKYYNEYSLYFLGLRDSQTFDEKPFADNIIKDMFKSFPFVKYPEVYSFENIDELFELHKQMNATDEGFVCVDYTKLDQDGCFKRVKVKNPAYLAIAHVKESGNCVRNLLQLVLLGEEVEFLSYFPEFEEFINPIKSKYDKYVKKINIDVQIAKDLLKKSPERKEYALMVRTMTNPALMFMMYDGKCDSWNKYVDIHRKKLKSFAKNLLKILKIKDFDFEFENQN